MILVYSIPHTGTHFVDKLLTDNGVPPNGSVHITGDAEDLDPYHKIIVPLRDPKKVAISWAKRFEVRGSQLWKCWPDAWRQLPRLVDDPRVFFFDLERRDLGPLSRKLGVDLVTDWTPENHMEHTPTERCISLREEREAVLIYNYVTGVQELRNAA